MDELSLEALRAIGETQIYRVGGRSVTLLTLVFALSVMVATLVVSRVLRHRAQRALDTRGAGGASSTVTNLVHYCVLIAGFGTAANVAGIDLSALFAAGAIFAIGLGFAMQSIAQNFVAGIILLVERTIRPGDVIEVDGDVMMVRELGIRASMVRSRDGEDIIIPNAVLIQNQVKNFTMSNSDYRIRVRVGVAYGSDMALTREVLKTAGRQICKKAHDQAPQVILVDFGDNAVIWEVAAWTNSAWERRVALDELRDLIWWGLKDAGVTIAFPQLDLHFDESALRALQGLAMGIPEVEKPWT